MKQNYWKMKKKLKLLLNTYNADTILNILQTLIKHCPQHFNKK
jgi:hypothetical protein